MPDANRKVKGTLHWVSCNHCMQAEVRLYDRLWKVENPVSYTHLDVYKRQDNAYIAESDF